MITHNVQQGSPEWHALRKNHFTASEAPAMMGASKYISRNDLLNKKALNIEEEIAPATQKLFDRGHAAEDSIRPHVEKIIGEEIYPATATDDDDYLLASFDGITILEDVIFEHKLWNEKLAEDVRNGELGPHYYWQLEQQLLVSGAEKALFVTSDGTPDKMEFLWYLPVPGRADQLLIGWKQFEKDMSEFTPKAPAKSAQGKVVAELPTLFVDMLGEVKNTNIQLYRDNALSFIKSISTDLSTDQDFADAEVIIKFCDKTEKELDLTKKQALAKTASIEELFRTIDDLKEAMRAKRLELNKLVKTRKEEIKAEIIGKAKDALADHVASLAERFSEVNLPSISADFGAAIKGKRTVKSIHDAIDEELARAKIEANRVTDHIDANLRAYRERANGFETLFADLQQIITKEKADFTLLVQSRIDAHKAAQEEVSTQEKTPDAESALIPASSSSGHIRQQAEESAPSGLSRNDFQRGYIQALQEYSYMEEGVLVVGNNGKTLEQAINDFLTEAA